MKYILIFTFLVLNVLVFGQNKKVLAPTPPMGWNSWNWFGKKEINEQNMKQCMDAMVKEGLLDAGYNYFVIDGGWRDTKLGQNGELLANPTKFPNGIKPLADYAHSLGLKFGLHTVPGTHDCGGDAVGGFGHEEVQIQQFVDWGLDFIKLDKCKYADGWDEDLVKQTYTKWRQLLDKSDRDIVLSISAYVWRDWYPEVGQMARTTFDIGAKANQGAHFDYTEKEENFLSIMAVAEENNEAVEKAGKGYWNDPDILVIGNPGLTIDEQKAHFALWCIMSSPLFLGNDPRNMTHDEKEIILNKVAISINQDPTEQGKRIKKDGDLEVWVKQLINGQKAVLILNRNRNETLKYTLNLQDLAMTGKGNISDVYSDLKYQDKEEKVEFEIKPHACVFLKVE